MKAFFVFIILVLGCSLNTVHALMVDYNQTEQQLQRWKLLSELIYVENPPDQFNSIRVYRNTIYDELADLFYNEFLNTGNPHFLILAINEASPNRRRELELLHPFDSPFLFAHSERRINRVYDDILFEIRDFSLADIYLFSYAPLGNANPQRVIVLLQHWTQQLPRLRRSAPLTAQIMSLVIAQGYQRMGIPAPVNELFRDIEHWRGLFPSHYVLFNLRTFIFQAHQQNYLTIALQLSRNIAYPLAVELGDKQIYFENLIDLANIRFDLGIIIQAMHDYERLLSDGIEYLIDDDIALIRNNLGVTYLNSGQFDRFLEFSLDAYTMALETGNIRFQLYILRNLYNYHRRQGDFSQALAYLNEIIALSENDELKKERNLSLIALALYYRDVVQDYELTLEAYLEAEKASLELNDFRALRIAMLGISQTLTQLGRFEESLNVLGTISETSNVSEGEPFFNEILVKTAATLINMEEWELAYQTLSNIHKSDFRKLSFNTFTEAKGLKIEILLQRQHTEAAQQLINELLPEVLSWLEESADAQTGFLRLDAEFEHLFMFINTFYLNQNNYQASLQLLDDIRNLTRSALFSNPLLKTRVLSENELFQHFILTNRIQRLRNQLASETMPGNRILLQNQVIHAQNQRNQLISNVQIEQQEINRFREIHQLQKYLSDKEQLLKIGLFNNQLFVYLITKESVFANIFPFTKNDEKKVEEILDLMASGKTDLVGLHDIYTTWFADIIDPSKSDMIVIPDGIFYRLPFETLPISEPETAQHYGSTTYLIESHQISYQSSLSSYIKDQQNKNRPYSYFFSGFGIKSFSKHANKNLSTLPFAEKEVEAIASTFPKFKSTNAFKSEESTEFRLREKAGESSIIHIASHSEVSNEHPLFSVIFMQPDSLNQDITNDGLVYVYELFEMNLESELIFLGSCSSASGTFLQGSGVLGFSRALSYAGAKSLIMNLWPAKDQSSAELAVMFYEYLSKGYSRAESLRFAKIDFMNLRNSNPAIWGSLVLYGEISPLSSKRISLFVAEVLIGIGVALIIVLVWLFRVKLRGNKALF